MIFIFTWLQCIETSGRNNTMFIVFDYHHFALQLEMLRRLFPSEHFFCTFISGGPANRHKEVGQSTVGVHSPSHLIICESIQKKTPKCCFQVFSTDQTGFGRVCLLFYCPGDASSPKPSLKPRANLRDTFYTNIPILEASALRRGDYFLLRYDELEDSPDAHKSISSLLVFLSPVILSTNKRFVEKRNI